MAIDSKVVAQVAHLARLKVDESDSGALSDRLNDILAMVDQLQQADVTDVAPMAHPLDVTQPLREDEVSEPNVRDKALDIAPSAEDGCFLVPRVIE
ncbi:MAG: Asp-tRNA(Asn)/Glu-tRNA(Gln) amidotransferase subunit GatC [Alcanivorax sp.]|jgi:aspartyl-tRNA(Asn)/glutamyl-tRNA(Gln) amidotransferase subunit C|uniref:Asp-tRNA(Asn)/Glu-tRNA(Gln) amidotransferase subunit GatC n=1 Tax=Alcanivorax TaxID=59753 RepID=UPI001A63DAFC|nr:Asp-tRNA(Asn)/Glu-tRNA(Gln) amidotransferase subunit GatC [Alcanivorax jadensis]MBL4569583.1 Asp-tRNA(Asn)/Glu-tRNA(Gln) amidotransferase subunit GatC [Alcanivorax sp.]MDF1636626.1 Asp-tRNA(Asn)/Glu-tRNA(Gln) amidotransferase subunit GatC [Alcanivorax jadensis]|tara:strand:+ start:1465 stop:1752 length:288 start_codon:yes stop_codon:yes gene_type:complete